MDFRLDALQQSSHVAEDDISSRMAVLQVLMEKMFGSWT
jgi:hypothetical protein